MYSLPNLSNMMFRGTLNTIFLNGQGFFISYCRNISGSLILFIFEILMLRYTCSNYIELYFSVWKQIHCFIHTCWNLIDCLRRLIILWYLLHSWEGYVSGHSDGEVRWPWPGRKLHLPGGKSLPPHTDFRAWEAWLPVLQDVQREHDTDGELQWQYTVRICVIWNEISLCVCCFKQLHIMFRYRPYSVMLSW